MGILDGNPKNEPLHYGEIHGVWHFSYNSKGVLSGYQAFKNHAGDHDLKDILDAAIKGAEMEINGARHTAYRQWNCTCTNVT